MTHLIQKTWTAKKEITIQNDSLLVNAKNIGDELEFKIKFEELGFDIVKQRNKAANIPFYGFLLFDLLYIWILISSVVDNDPFAEQVFWIGGLFLFALLTLATYRGKNKDVIYLTGGSTNLELLAKTPDMETVNSFIDTIHKSMRKYYKDKYSTFDPETPYEIKINQLKWLKEIQAVTEEEYHELLDKTKTDNVIGFQRTKRED